MEDDRIETRQTRFQPGGAIGLPRRISQSESRARTTRSFPATICAPPSLAAMLATMMKRLASRPSGPASTKHFWLGADGGANHLVGNGEKRLVEAAHQGHRPFDQPGYLFEQGIVFHQRQPLGGAGGGGEGEVPRVMGDDILSLLRIGGWGRTFAGVSPEQRRNRRGGARGSARAARKRWP